ncbi:MAG: nucleoside deaminase [Magnetospiraceae bacterium]
MPPLDSAALAARLLDVIENDILPKTRVGVAAGNKLFGAAILKKEDLSLVIAGTNNEVENPLWHGEVATLKAFYEMPAEERPATRDCVFLATHEPCSLCLSAITWTGFDNFYYLFGYTDTRDAFNIPHDLNILKEVFKVEGGAYARSNAYWDSHDLRFVVEGLPDDQRADLHCQITRIVAAYDEASASYQASKGGADIPLD